MFTIINNYLKKKRLIKEIPKELSTLYAEQGVALKKLKEYLSDHDTKLAETQRLVAACGGDQEPIDEVNGRFKKLSALEQKATSLSKQCTERGARLKYLLNLMNYPDNYSSSQFLEMYARAPAFPQISASNAPEVS